MHRSIPILYLLLISLNLSGQPNIADTMNVVLRSNLPDSAKVDKLISYIAQYSPNNPEAVLIYTDHAIGLSETLGDSVRLANSFNIKGIALYYLGDYNSALDYYFQSMEINEKSGSDNLRRDYNNVGLVLRNLYQHEEALEYLYKALEIQTNNPTWESNILNNIGIVYYRMKLYDKAIKYLSKAYAINQKEGALQSMAQNLNNIGRVSLAEMSYEISISYFKQALDINRQIMNRREEVRNLQTLAELHLTMKNYELFDEYMSKSREYLDEIGAVPLILRYLDLYSKYYSEISNYRQALFYREKFSTIRDSIFAENRKKQFSQLKSLADAEKEIQKMEFLKEIASIQEEKIRIQRQIQFGTAIFILLMIFTLLNVLRNLKIKKILNNTLKQQAKEAAAANKELTVRTEELKKANLELTIAKENAEKATRAKSEFLANMSHEIRTPMNSILGFSEIMFNTATDNKQKNYLKTILSSGKTLMSLINDILDLSRIEAGKLEISPDFIDMKPLIMEMKQVFLPKTMEKNLEFFIECDPNLPHAFFMDEIRLRQILLNLIGNAVKFTHHGSISIYAGMTKESNGENNLKIAIKDTGIGINPADQERIFESFTQQHGQDNREYGGTGLGLTISRRLCALMNATISLNSEPGKGSSFTVLFKNVRSTNQRHQKYNPYEWDDHDVEFSGQKILIVDDLANNRQLIREYLQSYNLQILEAENGEMAVEVAKTSLPHIIFMDIRMPVMGGYEATQIIKSEKETNRIPIVALTASNILSETDQINGLFDAHLRKPVQKKSVVNQLLLFLSDKTIKVTPKNTNTTANINTETHAVDPSIKQEFSDLFLENILHQKKVMFVNKLNDLHQNLLKFATQNDLEPLAAKCNELMESIDSYDFERIKKNLDEIMKTYSM